MKPLIGITTYYVDDRELGPNRPRGLSGQDMMMSTMDYSRCVCRAGGLPVAIPVIQDEEYMDELVEKMDGFLFSGGADVSPIKYGHPFKKGLGLVVPERDDFELKLLEKVIKSGKPILGICRGFQLINVFLNGTLHQDIGTAQITQLEHVGKMAPKYEFCHRVNLNAGSKIFQAFGTNELWVNSYHHQAVDKLGDGLEVTGRAEDDIIEVFEHKEYPFLVAVQWHPEMMAEVHQEQLSVFQLLIEKCKK